MSEYEDEFFNDKTTAIQNYKKLKKENEQLKEQVNLKLYSRRKLERENKLMKEAIEFALTQEELDYGMPEEQAKEFRMRRVFSILDEVMEEMK